MNVQLQNDMNQIKREYPAIIILSKTVRNLEQQMEFVITRWRNPGTYEKTLKDFMQKYGITDRSKVPNQINNLTEEQKEFVKERIQHYSKNGGYRHLSGNAIDISVKAITDVRIKTIIKSKIEALGYHIILEKGSNYAASISEATTFHVEAKSGNHTDKHTSPDKTMNTWQYYNNMWNSRMCILP
jgi:hypothetical protein